jgi:2-oxoglutarate dehydrogenase E1 component
MDADSVFESFGTNAGYVEDLYQLYRTNPELVGNYWAQYFSKFESAAGSQPVQQPRVVVNVQAQEPAPASSKIESIEVAESDTLTSPSIFEMIQHYRAWGHTRAKINPVRCLSNNEASIADGFPRLPNDNPEVSVFGFAGLSKMPLSELLTKLEQIYCASIGFEYAHIEDLEARLWLQEQIESRLSANFSQAELKAFLKFLVEAEVFEGQLHRTFVGQKRFSLEGGETLMPMLKAMLDAGAEMGLKESIIGMAHRGRLAVLHQICGKPIPKFFEEFEDRTQFSIFGSGDVKYHLGHETNFQTLSGQAVKVSMAVNPSHLEFVNPVVEGMVRAKQDEQYQDNPSQIMPLLLHGDAAFIGQGVVVETLNMAGVAAYDTRGTVHVIINNQVGFTTGPQDARSSRYSSDFAKAIGAPILHINSEDVEAACWAAQLAVEYRQRFGKDVVLDLYCYRKHGHNEADEPSFTQPVIYAELKNKPQLSEIFLQNLAARGLEKDDVENFRKAAVQAFNVHKASVPKAELQISASPVHGRLVEVAPETSVSTNTLLRVARSLNSLPSDFKLHPKLQQLVEKRVGSVESAGVIEWGLAEALAFGSLLIDGKALRLSGQDCGRGTFNHRHLVYHEYETDALYNPLTQIANEQGTSIEIYNSTLSEASVLGFEYGYALTNPNVLTMWEAQFGDFANGAQVIIDQFISSSEQKWGVLSGVTLLLPHGYEGQGPEHSSARLERFLQLCADGNMSVCYPTNSAQYFHMMRQQGLRKIKRPMVVMTPKSLLRAPEAMSPLSDFSAGLFNPVLADSFGSAKNKTVVFCSGKIAYDLMTALKTQKISGVEVMRIERLYPMPEDEIQKALKKAGKVAKYLWLQEEPRNMGAWPYIESRLRSLLDEDVHYCGRPESASPSTGSHHYHAVEQKSCINQVINALA